MSRYNINMRVRGAGLVLQDHSLLLVEYYTEEEGLHYVLPGGAVRPNETIREAVRREALEEACVDVEVGSLALIYEYAPNHDPHTRQGLTVERPPAVTMVFACQLVDGRPSLPDMPDHNQTGVRWVPLDELDGVRLSPPLHKRILEYAYQGGSQPVEFVEEWAL